MQYCTRLLTNREPSIEFATDLEIKKLIHLARMEEEVVDEAFEKLDQSYFNKIYDQLRKKPGNKYDFLTKGGDFVQFV